MPKFSPRQVATALGVSEASLKRWCDQGLLEFERTAGGHRRISREAVLTFARHSQRSLVAPNLLGFEESTKRSRARALSPSLMKELCLDGKETALRGLFRAWYTEGKPLEELCDQVIAPCFHQIGSDWEKGRIEVYQERFCCQLVIRLLHELRLLIPEPSDNAPPAMGCSLSRDPYQLPTSMVELVMREMGWQAEALGTNLTGATLARAVHDRGPKVFWLSVSAIADEEQLIADCLTLWQACRVQGTWLVLGGRALTPRIRSALGYTVFCDSMQQLKHFLLDTLGPVDRR